MPFDWQRLDDDEKVAVIDSAKKAIETRARGRGERTRRRAARAAALRRRRAAEWSFNMRRAAAPTAAAASAADDGRRRIARRRRLRNVSFVSPAELPDYRPAFGRARRAATPTATSGFARRPRAPARSPARSTT